MYLDDKLNLNSFELQSSKVNEEIKLVKFGHLKNNEVFHIVDELFDVVTLRVDEQKLYYSNAIDIVVPHRLSRDDISSHKHIGWYNKQGTHQRKKICNILIILNNPLLKEKRRKLQYLLIENYESITKKSIF